MDQQTRHRAGCPVIPRRWCLIQVDSFRKPELLSTLTDEAVRFILKLAAEACENLDAAQQERDSAVVYASELRSLLDRVAILLDSQPYPGEGGSYTHWLRRFAVREPLSNLAPGFVYRTSDGLHAAVFALPRRSW